MSTKKHISSLCKVYSVYEEIPEEFLAQTDVDGYFYHNILLDISQSHHRRVRNSKVSNKTSCAFKAYHFCRSELQQPFLLKEEVSIYKKEIDSPLNSLGEFFKAFDQASKVSQIPLPKPKFEIGCTKAINELFSHCYKDSAEHLNRKFDYRSGLKRTRFASFPSKSLNITVINAFLQKLSTWDTAKSNISTRIDFLLLTSVTFLRAITMCSEFTLDCRYDNSTNIFIGDVYCPNTNCSGKVCLHKKTLQSLGRSDYQYPQCASVCQVRNNCFEDQTHSFFLSFRQGVYIFDESPKSIQGVIGDVYCPGTYCSNRENYESLGGYVTTPRSVYACGKCGA